MLGLPEATKLELSEKWAAIGRGVNEKTRTA
jgi:hypothetical protein